MGSPEATPGRCNAKSKRKGYCKNYPAKGHTRCRFHAGRPIKHGRYSQRYKDQAAAGLDILDEVLEDPDLMDVRRPVALAQFLLYRAPLVPSEDLVKELAAARAKGDKPTAAELELARVDLLMRASRLVESLGRRQESATRQSRAAELLVSAVLPVTSEFVTKTMEIAGRYIDDEGKLDKMRLELQRALGAMIKQIDELGQGMGRG